jgi:hypothetical protein
MSDLLNLTLKAGYDERARLRDRVRALEAELNALSDKACASVLVYRAALNRLTDSFKYSAEVVTIARGALAKSADLS